MVGVVLACATAFAALAFKATAERARLVGDATVFMTSIWPLKVVTPK